MSDGNEDGKDKKEVKKFSGKTFGQKKKGPLKTLPEEQDYAKGPLWNLTVFSTANPTNHHQMQDDSKLNIKLMGHYWKRNTQFCVFILISSTFWRKDCLKQSLLSEGCFLDSEQRQ